jgi:hypothetical protein
MTDIFARLAADMAVHFPTAAGPDRALSGNQASSPFSPAVAGRNNPSDKASGGSNNEVCHE